MSSKWLALLLLVCGLGLALAWPNDAFGQTACPVNNKVCDEGTAYALCIAGGEASKANNPSYANVRCAKVDPGFSPYYGCKLSVKSNPDNYAYSCNPPAAHYYVKGCAERSEETGWKGGGSNGLGSVCHNGCAYDGSVYAGSPTGRLFAANGQVCKNSDLPAPETPAPGDGDGGGGGEIPGDGDGGGDGGSDPGTGPGNGGGDGGGGNGDGDGDGDGDGNGSGPGTGPGDGDGDGDGEGSTLPEGEMWKAPKDTMQSVFDEFYDKAKKTKAVDGITNFLKVSGGGSCPTFTLPASMFWRSMTYSAHCSGDFLAMLQLCGFVIFAFAAYAAVRISLT